MCWVWPSKSSKTFAEADYSLSEGRRLDTYKR